MKETLYFIVDVSGSMNEMGKIHLQRNLCRFAAQLRSIDQEKYADLDIRFYRWVQDISEITIQSDGDIPTFNTEGSSNLDDLSNFLSQHLKDTGAARILLLSDGFFSLDAIDRFIQWKNGLHILIRTVAVGTDADLLKLKKISTNHTVYLSENIASAIDSSIFGYDKTFATPVSTAQILHSEPAGTGGSEEDWDA